MLPGPTFVKTFLRTYAEALGLDPQVLVEEYRATYEPREEAEHLQQLGPTAVSRDRRRGGGIGPPPPRPWLLIGTPVMITALNGKRTASGIEVYAVRERNVFQTFGVSAA